MLSSSKKEVNMGDIDLKLRHRFNPFVEDMIVPVKSRQVKISKMGADNNVLFNQSTGEVHGTHVSTFKKVDGEQFIKLFTANIGMTFELSSAGIKTFSVLLWTVQHKALEKDQVMLDSFILEDFIEAHTDNKPPLKLSITTFKRGLNELERSQIIAKTVRQGIYYFNPNFVFNGDRIAFTTIIERKKQD